MATQNNQSEPSKRSEIKSIPRCQHQVQGNICITCTIRRVKQALDYEPSQADIDLLNVEIAKWRSDDGVRWAIEDEAERNELQELVVLTAAVKYLEADTGVNTAAYERFKAKYETFKNAPDGDERSSDD